MRCRIVGNSCDLIIYFCNNVIIGSCLLVFDAAEYSCCIRFCCRCCSTVFCRHRGCSLYAVNNTLAGSQVESKAFRIAPLIDGLGRLQRKIGGCIPVGNRQGRLTVIGNICYQGIAVSSLVDIYDDFMWTCIIGNARYMIIFFCDRVFVLTHSIVFNSSEYSCKVPIIDRSARHYILGYGIFRHRSTVNRSQIEGEACCISPFIDRLRCFQLRLCLGKGIGDFQAVRVICTIGDCCGQFICITILAYLYLYKMLACIVCDSRHMIISLFNSIEVRAWSIICDVSKYSR